MTAESNPNRQSPLKQADSVAEAYPGKPAASLFTPPAAAREPISWTPWIVAAAVVLTVALLLVVTHHPRPAVASALLPSAPYANSLAISGIQMSESTSLSGGKSTYIDGHIRNNGTRTLNSATVQVIFANEEAMPPQIETLPLALIRTHEPYVDTQSIADAPIAPNEDREFRLIFESIGSNWNGQIPHIQIVQTSQK